jgi:hypothetical protein
MTSNNDDAANTSASLTRDFTPSEDKGEYTEQVTVHLSESVTRHTMEGKECFRLQISASDGATLRRYNYGE